VTTTVRHDADRHRFEIVVDDEVAGFTEYRAAPGVRAFVHTVIDDRFGGQGLGGKLVRGALDETRADGLAVEPYCEFVRGWIGKHPEYVDLVPEAERERFEVTQ
jgi:uncharacterized protein